jgi:UDP-N-acetylglucosamine 2-epimerase (non-hydrolysing)
MNVITMKNKRSYAVIVGARPNFIKVAPFLKRAEDYPHLDFTLVHTGQHFDENMSKVFFEQMGIRHPDIQLDIKGEYHTEKIGKMFSALKKVVADPKYDGVVVFGDINSTLAGAIAAAATGKQIIHIEAGLRSHDRRMPEEINRAVTDHLSHVLFATEQTGLDNLLLEGIEAERVHLVGNIMIESIEIFKDKFNESNVLKTLSLQRGGYVVATLHRVENTDEKNILKRLLQTLEEVAKHYTVVFPLHPGTKQKIELYGLGSHLDNIVLTEPLGYLDFMKLVIDSKGVISDSGGIQEETSHLGIPCCTLRDNTERPITITHGTNKLVPINDIDPSIIIAHLAREDFKPEAIPLWDKNVSTRILDLL